MKRLIILISACLLVACSQSLSDYQNTTPKLDLKEFFQGEIKAWGVIAGRDGTIKRRFTATISASWQGDNGTLDETFLFDDGEQQTRIWTLEKRGDSYIGTAGDVVGIATGKVAGFAMNWSYVLKIPVDGSVWQFKVNDWLYQLDENVVMNQGVMTKFGVEVGQITLFMQKQ